MRQVIQRFTAWVTNLVTPPRTPGRHTAAYLAGQTAVRPAPAPAEPYDAEPFIVRPYVLAHEERVRERRRRLRRGLTQVRTGLYLGVEVAR